ncbi:hypothetical protein SHIRM173S_02602 [Streptomyces hirsutus]
MRWSGYGFPCSGSPGPGSRSRGPGAAPQAREGHPGLRCRRQVCFDASSITVMSDGAPIRVGGPQAPAPRLTYSWVSP